MIFYTQNIEKTNLKQNCNETVLDFYKNLQHLLNLKISYIKTNIVAEEGFFQNYVFRILLWGLKKPIHSLLRAK